MRIEQAVVNNDARHRLRVRCSAKVLVETGDRRVVSGQMRDVGLHSLYLFANDTSKDILVHGENVKVKVAMERDNSTLTIEVDGHVVRMDDTGFVVQFERSLHWWPVFIIFPNQKAH